ncbi:hypothetical protein Ddc_10301 [Ditylenchus destructor]|nr:hypothetical protein Ddc_10301 [Ditylenchus destructor]
MTSSFPITALMILLGTFLSTLGAPAGTTTGTAGKRSEVPAAPDAHPVKHQEKHKLDPYLEIADKLDKIRSKLEKMYPDDNAVALEIFNKTLDETENLACEMRIINIRKSKNISPAYNHQDVVTEANDALSGILELKSLLDKGSDVFCYYKHSHDTKDVNKMVQLRLEILEMVNALPTTG